MVSNEAITRAVIRRRIRQAVDPLDLIADLLERVSTLETEVAALKRPPPADPGRTRTW